MNNTSKQTKTIETYINPEEFEKYTQLGFVVFMTRPTDDGEYKAVKIEMIN